MSNLSVESKPGIIAKAASDARSGVAAKSRSSLQKWNHAPRILQEKCRSFAAPEFSPRQATQTPGQPAIFAPAHAAGLLVRGPPEIPGKIQKSGW
jgi:hypothetical protein